MKKKLLVVDDEKNFRDVIRTRLENNGYDVVLASDGDDGVNKAKEEKPDLILLDIMMPKMDGYTVLKTLKGDDDLKDIPVIMLTCKENMKDLCGPEGIRGYIIKPYDKDDLLKTIAGVLG